MKLNFSFLTQNKDYDIIIGAVKLHQNIVKGMYNLSKKKFFKIRKHKFCHLLLISQKFVSRLEAPFYRSHPIYEFEDLVKHAQEIFGYLKIMLTDK